MVYHVGIYPRQGKIEIYDSFDKSVITFEEGNVMPFCSHTEITNIFERILSHIDGNMGCLCICLGNGYNNDIRVHFIQSAKKIGFYKVEIIDERMADYLMAVSQTSYKPKNDDVIWIFNDDGCHIWKKEEDKAVYVASTEAKFVSERILQEIVDVSRLNKFPDAVFVHRKVYYPKKYENAIYDTFPTCQFFTFLLEDYDKTALKKAKIMAGYSDHIAYDAKTIFEGNFYVRTDVKDILSVKWQNTLPLTEFAKLDFRESEKSLFVCYNEETVEPFEPLNKHCLPNFKESLLSVTIDTNGIYSMRCINLSDKCDHNLCHQTTKTRKEKLELPALNFEANCFDILGKYVFLKKISEADIKADVVGIDLGTSRCYAAINRANGIQTIALDNTGERFLPSFIGFDERNPKCGQVVVNRMQFHAKSTIFDAKRIIGRSYSNVKADKNWCFELICLNIAEMEQISGKSEDFEMVESDSCLIKLQSFEGETLKYPEEISAVLLKHIKQKSEEFQGKPLSEVVIAVPAAFTESQRNATHDAALVAGWKKIHLLPEPIAASFAYFIDRPIPSNFTFLLFDLGGGTLDVCIFKITNTKIQVVSRSGDSNLGGRDFDNILIEYFKGKLKKMYGIFVPEEKKYKIMLQCQKIKENLSEIEKDEFDVQEIRCETEEYILITRKIFEDLSLNLLDKIKATIQRAMNKSKSFKIDKVLLAGGGCRMPMIKKYLKKTFKDSEVCCEKHPDEVVAIGAAYYANYLNLIVNDDNFRDDSKKCSIM
uniref:Heat shock protein 70 n=1 Tax=Panagrolaimus sp. ES5 TaxID=591445 RepID=A0AC34F9C6_9BILA